MNFRTEIQPLFKAAKISHRNRLMLLGSCFTDNIGSRLVRDGFECEFNPLGPLYNPLSISRTLSRALMQTPYTDADLVLRDGIYHCLDFESRRQNAVSTELLNVLNADFQRFAAKLHASDTWLITFGTAYAFEFNETGAIVGNCHKLSSNEFTRRRLSVDEIVDAWLPLIDGRRVIFTVSPIRHQADGLHGNQLSKSILLLAIERLVQAGAEYFPAYEIMMDDLRDYRFYEADLKHPSAMAADYIYEIFEKSYFTEPTLAACAEFRKQAKLASHRPILKS